MQAQPQPQTRTRHSSRPVNEDGHPASIFVNGKEHGEKNAHFYSPSSWPLLNRHPAIDNGW